MFSIKDKKGVVITEGKVVRDTLGGMTAEVKFGFCKKLGFTGWYVENAAEWFVDKLNPTNDNDQNDMVEIIGDIKENSLKELSEKPIGRSGYGGKFMAGNLR